MIAQGRINKKNILTDADNRFFLRCSTEFREDMYEMYGLDVDDQDFLLYVLNSDDGTIQFDVIGGKAAY